MGGFHIQINTKKSFLILFTLLVLITTVSAISAADNTTATADSQVTTDSQITTDSHIATDSQATHESTDSSQSTHTATTSDKSSDTSSLSTTTHSDSKDVSTTKTTTDKDVSTSSDNVKTDNIDKKSQDTNTLSDKNIKTSENTDNSAQPKTLDDTSSSTVSSYSELVETVNSVKSMTGTDSYTIELGENSDSTAYDVTETINWGSSSSITNLTINGNGQTINGNNAYRFITVASGYELTINDLTIEHCAVTGSGGAISNDGTLTVVNSTFANDTSSGSSNYGGGIYSTGTLNVINSTFLDNNAYFASALTNWEGTLNIVNSTFANGTTTGLAGAVYTRGTTNVVNSTFTKNSASGGGGALYLYNNVGDATVVNTTFINNSATNDGGAVYVRNLNSYGTTLTNIVFINNTSGSEGGAAYLYNGAGNVAIKNATFINNTDTSTGTTRGGGAISTYGANYITVDDSVFINNSAVVYGGAIFNYQSNMTITNTNFTENTAQYGGAVANYMSSNGRTYGNTTLVNCILTDNSATDLGNAIYNPATLVLENNIITDVTIIADTHEEVTITSPIWDNTTESDVTITINGEEITVTPSNGTVSTVYTFTTGGEIPITFTYPEYNSNTIEVTADIDDSKIHVTSYQELVDAVAQVKESTDTNAATIVLEANDDPSAYDVTSTITWGSSQGTTELTIVGNSQTINGLDTHEFLVISSGYTLTIEDLNIENCYYDGNGGAIRSSGNLTLINTTFSNNKANNGAAVYVSVMRGSMFTAINSIFANNTASNHGGAIYNDGRDIVITDSEFTSNTAAGYGGVIYVSSLANNTITNSIFTDNTATTASAAYLIGNNIIENSTFTSNVATNEATVYANGGLTLSDSVFTNNSAVNGSALYIYNNAGDSVITNSEFISNNGVNGSAIYLDGARDVTIDNSTFINNTALENGGAIYNRNTNATITNSVFTNNTASYGDAIFNYNNDTIHGALTLESNTITSSLTGKSFVETTITSPICDQTLTDDVTITIDSETITVTPIDGVVSTVYIFTTYGNMTIDFAYPGFEGNTIQVNADIEDNSPLGNIVREDNFYRFFNTDGTFKDVVNASQTLYFAGTITDKNMTIDIPLNLVSYEEDPVQFKNVMITIKDGAQGTNITGFVIDNENYSEYAIGIIDSSDIRIENNTITMTNQEGKTRAIYINGSVNNKILGNTITTYGPSDDIDYSSMTGFANTMSIMVYNSSYNVIDNNVITTGYTTFSGRLSSSTIVGVGIYGDYDFSWTTWQESYKNASYNNITNNIITATGYNYTYGIDLLYGAYYSVVENNTITCTSNLYSAGIQVSGPGSYIKITNNTIDLKADNVTYGIILQYVYGSVSDNVVTYNTVTTDSSTTYLIELYYTDNNNISFNDLKSENANVAMGIGLAMSNNNYIEYNNIDVSGTNDKTPYPGDHITAKNTGIGLYTYSTGNIITNNNVLSTVETGDCYAVDLNTTTSNTVTDNYLISTGYEGDESVFSTSSTNTIKDNAPTVSITADGRTVTVSVYVGAENDGYIIVKVNNKTLKDETGKTIMAYVENGLATYTFDLNASSVDRDYEVSYVYSGSAGVKRGSQNVTISPEVATVVVDAIDNAKAGQTVTLTAHITDSNGNIVTSGKVVFKLNGKTLKDADGNTIYGYVDENGIATITYTLPDNYSAKDYVLTAVFQGSGYERAEANSTLTIVKTTPNIVPDETVFGDDNKITITQQTESVQIKATINDPETNAPINTTTVVTIKINDKTVTQEYVTDGVIDMTIYTSSFKNLEYNITIVVGENSQYARTTFDAILEVVTPTSLAIDNSYNTIIDSSTPVGLTTDNSYNGTLDTVTPVGLETSSSYNGTIVKED